MVLPEISNAIHVMRVELAKYSIFIVLELGTINNQILGNYFGNLESGNKSSCYRFQGTVPNYTEFKMKFFLGFFVFQVVALSASTHNVHYVKTVDSSPLSCPGQPCLTLDQYNQQTETYFTTGSTFVFLAGNHTINTTVNLTSISEITLRGERNSQVNILCLNRFGFIIQNVSHLSIEGLVFLSASTTIGTVAMKIIDSNGVWIHNVGFQGSFIKTLRGLHITSSDTITVTSCSFEGNSAHDGGAIYVTAESNLTLNASRFIVNIATRHGGAIYASGSNLTLSDNMFSGNIAGIGGAMYVTAESSVTISDNAFTHNRAVFDGGAIYSKYSIVSIYGSTKNSSILSSEGYCRTCDLITTIPKSIPYEEVIMELNEAFCATHFTNNTATRAGGAVVIDSSTVLFSGSVIMFRYNSAQNGGAIFIDLRSRVTSNAYHLFFNSNKALDRGGGFQMRFSDFHTEVGNMYFLYNSATQGGGIYYADGFLLLLSGNSYFIANRAESGYFNKGGGLAISGSFTITFALFIENSAAFGGGIYTGGNFSALGEIYFFNNTALICGGAMKINHGVNVCLNNVSAIANSNSALCISESNVTFSGRINISNNTGTEGGGIQVVPKNNHIYFTGSTVLYGNKAGLGGAIYLPFGTELTFSGDTLFSHNTADTNGGAIYSEYTNIAFEFNSATYFKYNTAENGGAIYLTSTSSLTFNGTVNLSMSYNHATKYGGGIYKKDVTTAKQCDFIERANVYLPYCFIRFLNARWFYSTLTLSQNNSADISGTFLHGGLLDRCQLGIINDIILFNYIFRIRKDSHEISSEPYQLCFCVKERWSNCTDPKSIEIYPGQKFHLSLIALDQTKTSVTTKVTAVSATSRLNSYQSLQKLKPGCSKLSYNLYSSNDTDQLILYPDGPCRDTGLARAVVNVMFKQCPDGFMKSGENCDCEEILNEYNASCTINDNVTISRKTGSEFWVQSLYKNGIYQGLIHYKTCPRDYCKTREVTLSLENPDTQCDLNRSGLLCGECTTKHSLMLGSSRCHVCPNTYLALLLPFAAAGIALVVFLSILRLTVATGMINSVILYANFVQINRSIFLPTDSTRNILTVFIAWLNLDLGFETCFYDGMTAYAQTWLQFAFPLYVWMLMGLIIVTCRYSVTLSKLIGHNPMAVLATLLLMSYNKVLKIMIDVYSFARLDYPQHNTRLVWLKDANVVFLGSKHLSLTVVTSLVLVFIFLPYTLLLLLGYKLYGFSGRKGLRWLNRLKPLLDSYYAPYNTHTRYWTGFLLLVRCVLYSVFSLGDTHKSLVSIIITFTALVGVVWISSKVYISRIANTVEVSVYLNLIILSAVSTNSSVSAKLFDLLVALVFVTMLGIIIYHFHLLYIAQSAMWTKMKDWMKHIISKPHTNPPPDTEVTSTPHNVPSTSVIELREPLLVN